MMIFAGHVGLALIIAYLLRLNPLLTVIGGVLPDLDALLSFIGQRFSKVHRKITHSLLFITLFMIIALFQPIIWALVIGLITHLIADLDSWGVPLLYPLSNKHYSIRKINHEHSYNDAMQAIKEWFRIRSNSFWIEWALLITGIILTLDYWFKLIASLLGLS